MGLVPYGAFLGLWSSVRCEKSIHNWIRVMGFGAKRPEGPNPSGRFWTIRDCKVRFLGPLSHSGASELVSSIGVAKNAPTPIWCRSLLQEAYTKRTLRINANREKVRVFTFGDLVLSG